MDSIPFKIQIISIIGTLIFLGVIFRLISKGRLREEYSIIWLLSTFVLIVLSIWRNGLIYISQALGVFYPPSLLFLFLLFAIICFLVHLSIVNSKQHQQIKTLSQEIALLKNKFSSIANSDSSNENTVKEKIKTKVQL